MSRIVKSLIGAAAIAGALLGSQAQANVPIFGDGMMSTPPVSEAQPQAQVKPQPTGNYGFKRGKIVDFTTDNPAGSVIISTSKHVLFYILGNGKAVKYRVATGKPGFEWAGSHHVSSKVEWPDWRPPDVMRKRRPELPAYMKGGPENPLGARAIYLGSSMYRIHGTNEPSSIGKSASSGCIRMLNADVTELYNNIKLGALVVVM
jgi:lipoprotein-anchoring transpeptidase ErfK/SrfK